MSIQIMSEVWKDAPVSGTELLMLLALADSCNDDRECWPSVRHLMHKVRVSEPQARRLIKNLELNGLIQVVVKGGKGAAGRESNLYRVCEVTPIADDTTDLSQMIPPPGIAGDTLNHHKKEPSIEAGKRARKSKSDFTLEDALIDAWARARRLDAIDLGADYHTKSDRTIATRLLTWSKPPTASEITQCVVNSTRQDYPFAFLEKDIIDLRSQLQTAAPAQAIHAPAQLLEARAEDIPPPPEFLEQLAKLKAEMHATGSK